MRVIYRQSAVYAFREMCYSEGNTTIDHTIAEHKNFEHKLFEQNINWAEIISSTARLSTDSILSKDNSRIIDNYS